MDTDRGYRRQLVLELSPGARCFYERKHKTGRSSCHVEKYVVCSCIICRYVLYQQSALFSEQRRFAVSDLEIITPRGMRASRMQKNTHLVSLLSLCCLKRYIFFSSKIARYFVVVAYIALFPAALPFFPRHKYK